MSVNSHKNLVSSEELIGEFLIDFNMVSTDFIGRLNRHITRGIELMQIDTFYTRCIKAFTAEENRTPIPCGAKHIEAIVLSSATGGSLFLDISNNALRLINSEHSDGLSEVYGYVDDGYLKLKDFEGKGFFLYKGLPKTSKGFLKIPDDAFVKEALLFFLIAKLALSGYKHKVVTREEAEVRWAELYPQARNSVNFPTVDDIEQYTIMNTSPLYNNIFRLGSGEDLSNILPNISLLDNYPNAINKFYSFEELAEAFGVDEWSSTEL